MADPIDTDTIRANYCGGQKRANWQAYIFSDIAALGGEADRLRAENALLRGDNATLGSTVTELRDQLREALGEPT